MIKCSPAVFLSLNLITQRNVCVHTNILCDLSSSREKLRSFLIFLSLSLQSLLPGTMNKMKNFKRRFSLSVPRTETIEENDFSGQITQLSIQHIQGKRQRRDGGLDNLSSICCFIFAHFTSCGNLILCDKVLLVVPLKAGKKKKKTERKKASLLVCEAALRTQRERELLCLVLNTKDQIRVLLSSIIRLEPLSFSL